MSALPINSLPAGALAFEPQSVRAGGSAAQNAYEEGVAFENVLVSQLAHQLGQTVPGLSGDGSGGLGGSGDPLSGSALGAYSSLITQALGDGVMSGGGTGVAMEIARALDPALGHPTPAAGSTGPTGGATP